MNSFFTKEEIDALQESKLRKGSPFAISGVSKTQFSVARHYGGCKYMGWDYTYIPLTDELIRVDVMKWLKQRRNKEKKNKVKVNTQLKLF